jgi:putative glycosyltransferase
MKISVVTTLYKSEFYVAEFYERCVRTVKKITDDYEIIFVNDGSPDQALQKVLDLQAQDGNIVAVDLSRNFGHHRAIMTGLQHADGDFVFLIDSDLEEEPEILQRYFEEIEQDKSVDVVYGVQEKRKGGAFERLSGQAWYFFFSFLSDIDYPVNSLTARLMSRRYVEAVKEFPERELEIWGVFVLAGFSQKTVIIPKGNKGETSYTLTRKLKVAVNSITSFSSKPLIALFVIGMVMTFISFIFILYLLFQKFVQGGVVEGWTGTLVSIWFIGGLIIFSLGIIGIYISKMFLEIKARPLTIVRKIYRIEK